MYRIRDIVEVTCIKLVHRFRATQAAQKSQKTSKERYVFKSFFKRLLDICAVWVYTNVTTLIYKIY